MICLGNAVVNGFLPIARKALLAAREHGEAAVFIGKNGVAAAVAHYESGYRQALESHAAYLAGVYRYEGGTWVRDNAWRAALDLKQAYRSIRHAGQPVSPARQPARKPRGAHSGANAALGKAHQVPEAQDLGQREHHGRSIGGAEQQRVLEVSERAIARQSVRAEVLAHGGAA
jgi:hypothetical protein